MSVCVDCEVFISSWEFQHIEEIDRKNLSSYVLAKAFDILS